MSARRRQSGLAMVEFVVVAPILLLLMLAGSELVRVFVQYSTLAHSVRDALVWAAREANKDARETPTLDSTAVDNAKKLIRFGNIAGTGPEIFPGLTDAQIDVRVLPNNRDVRIFVNYPYQSMFGARLPLTNISSSFTLNITNQMRYL